MFGEDLFCGEARARGADLEKGVLLEDLEPPPISQRWLGYPVFLAEFASSHIGDTRFFTQLAGWLIASRFGFDCAGPSRSGLQGSVLLEGVHHLPQRRSSSSFGAKPREKSGSSGMGYWGASRSNPTKRLRSQRGHQAGGDHDHQVGVADVGSAFGEQFA